MADNTTSTAPTPIDLVYIKAQLTAYCFSDTDNDPALLAFITEHQTFIKANYSAILLPDPSVPEIQQPLLNATINGKKRTSAQFLIELSVDINLKPTIPTPKVHEALGAFHTAVAADELEIAEQLLNAGANLFEISNRKTDEEKYGTTTRSEDLLELTVFAYVKSLPMAELIITEARQRNQYSDLLHNMFKSTYPGHVLTFQKMLLNKRYNVIHLIISTPEFKQPINRGDLFHLLRRAYFEDPSGQIELNGIFTQLEAEGISLPVPQQKNLNPDLNDWHIHKGDYSDTLFDAYKLNNFLEHDEKDGKLYPNKEAALRKAIVDIADLMKNIPECLKYLKMIDWELERYYQAERAESYPTLSSDHYTISPITDLKYPIPNSMEFKGIDDHNALRKTLLALLRKYNLGKKSYIWVGLVDYKIADEMVKNGNLLEESDVLTSSLHGSVHSIDLIILGMVLEQQNQTHIRTQYMDDDGEIKNLTIQDILNAIFELKTYQPSWSILFDIYSHQLEITFNSPHELHTFIMNNNNELPRLASAFTNIFCKNIVASVNAHNQVYSSIEPVGIPEYIKRLSQAHREIFFDAKELIALSLQRTKAEAAIIAQQNGIAPSESPAGTVELYDIPTPHYQPLSVAEHLARLRPAAPSHQLLSAHPT